MAFKKVYLLSILIAVVSSHEVKRPHSESNKRPTTLAETIQRGIDQWEQDKLVRDEVSEASAKEKCYVTEKLGCFYVDEGPMHHLEELPVDLETLDTYFLLYNSKVEGHVVDFYNLTELSKNEVTEGPVIFITHGFTEDGTASWLHLTKDSVLEQRPNANVFIMSWKKGASMDGILYVQASVNTVICGRQLSVLANHLTSLGLKPEEIHGLGHSLGSHVMAFASNWLLELGGTQFGRITGMDPAHPLFYVNNMWTVENGSNLNYQDADFVDIIHTNSGKLVTGHTSHFGNIGHVDFYVNGGREQPGCPDLILGTLTGDENATCHHNYAHEVMELHSPSACKYVSFGCEVDDFNDDFVYGDCSLNSGKGEMGMNVIGTGAHYLITKSAENNPNYCGQHYRIRVLSGDGDEGSTKGTFQLSLIDSEGNQSEKQQITDSENTEIKRGEWNNKIFLTDYDSLSSIVAVQVRYIRYEGWFSKGEKEWPIQEVQVEDGVNTYYGCKGFTILNDEELIEIPVSKTPCKNSKRKKIVHPKQNYKRQ